MPKLLDEIECDECGKDMYYIVSSTCVNCDPEIAWSLPNIPRCTHPRGCMEQQYKDGLCYYDLKIKQGLIERDRKL